MKTVEYVTPGRARIVPGRGRCSHPAPPPALSGLHGRRLRGAPAAGDADRDRPLGHPGLRRDAMPLLTDELKSWIGREVTYTAPEELGRASDPLLRAGHRRRQPALHRRRLRAGRRASLGDRAAHARRRDAASTRTGRPTPTATSATSGTCPWQAAGSSAPGNEYEFFRPVLPSDRISRHLAARGHRRAAVLARRHAALRDVGRAFVDQRGERLAMNRETIVYQPLDPP